MHSNLRIIIAQLDFLVGDIAANAQKIMLNVAKARDTLAGEVIVFPELALTGYSPEDLLLRPGMEARLNIALAQIAQASYGIDVIVGHPHKTAAGLYNAASVLREGRIIATYHKRYLPNVQVFDEKRYFLPGEEEITLISFKGKLCALTICEDIWQAQTMQEAKQAGAQAMIVLNASPYHEEKVAMRRNLLKAQARRGHMPIVYVNLVGGQDELVFDGGSFVVNEAGDPILQAPFFSESLLALDWKIDEPQSYSSADTSVALPSEEDSIYQALVLGLRDYVRKNGFKSVILGMSGGIDSALSATIALDALGADAVFGVLMPTRYTSALSNEAAIEQCKSLNISYQILSIEPVFSAYLQLLAEPFKNQVVDTSEENLQARCRGTVLMALSNKFGHLVLATGNKSEMAVGYCTLYGDMVGGFCVLKDVWKTMVYRLAHYRNRISPAIPLSVLTRAPSAELAPDQFDQDHLPAYEVLDQILSYYIEQDEDLLAIVARGFDATTVQQVIRLVNRNEYKRRQAPIGVCITTRAFGRNRRYPITSGYEY